MPHQNQPYCNKMNSPVTIIVLYSLQFKDCLHIICSHYLALEGTYSHWMSRPNTSNTHEFDQKQTQKTQPQSDRKRVQGIAAGFSQKALKFFTLGEEPSTESKICVC
ncbi:hypothetical protein SAY87_021176 [Trapa incisa]|uniref:Uncharacterized protein n=1 Tax=Trapa incisa TaxID=236973 RepID=A0AAN7JWS1_9MYRT|nr:hypothetical protein SAY87_021176 [Trapa incisa]